MDKQCLKTQIAMRQAEFPATLISRENELQMHSGKIITVPGVRRCGKSSRMELVANRLLQEGVSRNQILWIGFDDERLVKMSSDDLETIIEAYREMFPMQDFKDVYVFFDEIQLIEGWEFFVMRLYKHYTKNIYIGKFRK